MLLRIHNPIRVLTALGKWAYDAVMPSLKRPSATGINRSEDAELLQTQRAKLVSAGRDIHRNFGLVGWMVRKHLDYVSTFEFQGKLEDPVKNAKVEAFIAWWSHKENFDVAHRHDRHAFTRIAEIRRLLDGDFFISKLDGAKRVKGKVQGLEGDRIRSQYGTTTGVDIGESGLEVVQGVEIDEWGASVGYHVWKRRRGVAGIGGSGFVYERKLQAKWVYHHFYSDRIDQTRGISPFAPVYNSLADLYKGFDYALQKMKVSQMLGLILTREGEIEEPTPGSGECKDGEARYPLKMGDDPFKLELDPGDKAEFIESKNPSTEFQAFAQSMIALVLKALDIPYSFYAENYSNYSGSRQALLQYEQSAENRRRENRNLLNDLTMWRLKMAIEDGDPMLAGVTLDDLKWEWVASALPWVDPLKEVTANIAAVANGFDSTVGVCKSQGKDAFEIGKEQADYEKRLGDYRESIGLPRVPASNATSYVQLAQLATQVSGAEQGVQNATAA